MGRKGSLAAGDAQNGLQRALGARRCAAHGLLVSGNVCTQPRSFQQSVSIYGIENVCLCGQGAEIFGARRASQRESAAQLSGLESSEVSALRDLSPFTLLFPDPNRWRPQNHRTVGGDLKGPPVPTPQPTDCTQKPKREPSITHFHLFLTNATIAGRSGREPVGF